MHRYHSTLRERLTGDLRPSASFLIWDLMPALILLGTLLIIGIGSVWAA